LISVNWRGVDRWRGLWEGTKVAVLEAVLWDHDGTLVDTEPYWIESELALAARFGARWTVDDAISIVGSPLEETARLMQLAGVPLPNEEIIVELCNGVIRSIDEKGVRWLPGVQQLLTEIVEAGIRCAIVSNAWRPVVERTISALPEVSIEFVLTGDEMKYAKPDPWPYSTAIQTLGVAAGNAIVIEDSLSGTLSAEAAGIPLLVVPSVQSIPDAPGRSRVNSLADVSLDTLRAIVAGQVLSAS
jgi:HAD superfamily hydrolase (TIGR01509 family)